MFFHHVGSNHSYTYCKYINLSVDNTERVRRGRKVGWGREREKWRESKREGEGEGEKEEGEKDRRERALEDRRCHTNTRSNGVFNLNYLMLLLRS